MSILKQLSSSNSNEVPHQHVCFLWSNPPPGTSYLKIFCPMRVYWVLRQTSRPTWSTATKRYYCQLLCFWYLHLISSYFTEVEDAWAARSHSATAARSVCAPHVTPAQFNPRSCTAAAGLPLNPNVHSYLNTKQTEVGSTSLVYFFSLFTSQVRSTSTYFPRRKKTTTLDDEDACRKHWRCQLKEKKNPRRAAE